MSRSASLLGTLIRFVGPPAVLLAGIGGFWALAASREKPQPKQIEAATLLVETVPVSEMSGGVNLDTDGVVVPFRTITLSSEAEGRVVEKSDNCRAGRTVAAGELLLKIDPANYELEVARLERERDQTSAALGELDVQIANADASMTIAEEEVALNREELERLVAAERRGAVTPQQRDVARRTELASRSGLLELQNQKRLLEAQRTRLEEGVKLVEAQLAQARLDLERTEIHAPIDGVVVTADIEKNSYLKRGDAVVTIDDTTAVEVSMKLEMRAIAWLRANQAGGAAETLGPYEVPRVPVTLTYSVLGNVYSWQGTLTRFDGVGVDERTRTVPCRVLVEDPQAVSLRAGSPDLPVAAPTALMRGMYVKVLLHSQPAAPLLSIPEAAIRPGNMVWAVRDGKLSQFHLPAARLMHGSMVVAPQVTELHVGDRVVVSPLPSAKVGMAVRVRETPDVDGLASPQTLTAGESVSREGEIRR